VIFEDGTDIYWARISAGTTVTHDRVQPHGREPADQSQMSTSGTRR
jgi:hypothetical protein